MFTRRSRLFAKIINGLHFSPNSTRWCHIKLNEDAVHCLQKSFNLPLYKAQSLIIQYPTIQNVTESQVEPILDTLAVFGISKENVLKNPKILNVHENTLSVRCSILQECCFCDINLSRISGYLTLISKNTIQELKNGSLIPKDVDMWNELKKCFHLYPDIQKQLVNNTDYSNKRLIEIRMDILKLFLCLKFNMTDKEFYRLITTYTSIKNKSLENICKVLKIVEDELKFPQERIQAHGFIFECLPDNIMKSLTVVKHIGGVDIRNVMFKYPLLIKTNYKSILKMKEMFKNEGISEEAQKRHPEIFTLSTATVESRIQEFKADNKLKSFFINPRILGMIYYKNKITSRMIRLEITNKRCPTLHKLLTNNANFDKILQINEDKSRGIDLNRFFSKIVPDDNDLKLLKDRMARHPYWTYVPLQSVMETYEYLTRNYKNNDIIKNEQLLLYSVDKIENAEKLIDKCMHKEKNYILRIQNGGTDKTKLNNLVAHIKFEKLSACHRLGLILYLIEKEYRFTGDGVWNAAKQSQNVENNAISLVI